MRTLFILFISLTMGNALLGQVKLETEQQKQSYAVGVNVATSLLSQDLPLDLDSFLAGLKATYNRDNLAMTQEEIQEALRRLSETIEQSRADKTLKSGAMNKKTGEDYLAENKKKDGIILTKSGLQYKIIKKGDGKKPIASDVVKVHYEGRLINGDVFDSSYQRGEPAQFPLNRVIKGWTEVLQLMPVGSKYQVSIPADLAYGVEAPPSIGPNQVLIFDIELLAIEK